MNKDDDIYKNIEIVTCQKAFEKVGQNTVKNLMIGNGFPCTLDNKFNDQYLIGFSVSLASAFVNTWPDRDQFLAELRETMQDSNAYRRLESDIKSIYDFCSNFAADKKRPITKNDAKQCLESLIKEKEDFFRIKQAKDFFEPIFDRLVPNDAQVTAQNMFATLSAILFLEKCLSSGLEQAFKESVLFYGLAWWRSCFYGYNSDVLSRFAQVLLDVYREWKLDGGPTDLCGNGRFFAPFLCKGGKIFDLNFDPYFWEYLDAVKKYGINYDLGKKDDKANWSSSPNQNYFPLHGKHGFYTESGDNQNIKFFPMPNQGWLDHIAESCNAADKVYIPIILHGDSQSKLTQIMRYPHTSHAYTTFIESVQKEDVALFIYGCSLSNADHHIVRELTLSKIKYLCVSIYGDPDSAENKALIQRAQNIWARRLSALNNTGQPFLTRNTAGEAVPYFEEYADPRDPNNLIFFCAESADVLGKGNIKLCGKCYTHNLVQEERSPAALEAEPA